MAIGKLIKGSNASGLVDYLLGANDNQGRFRPKVAIVGGTLGFDGASAKRQFSSLKKLRPSLSKNTVHMSISLPVEDRDLTDQEWAAIGDHWAKGMGFQAYVTVCHGDHIHIAASRITLDGTVVSDSHDYRRSESLIREIETTFKLIPVAPSHLLKPDRNTDHIAAPKSGELMLAEKGEISSKAQLQQLLTDLTATPITASDFVDALEGCGDDVRPNISTTTGRLSGFAFGLDGHVLTASALGRGFSLKNLEKRGFSYVRDRDFQKLSEAKERSLERAIGPALGDEHGGAARGASGDTRTALPDQPSVGPAAAPVEGAAGTECPVVGAHGETGPTDAGIGEIATKIESASITLPSPHQSQARSAKGTARLDQPKLNGLQDFLVQFEARIRRAAQPLSVLQKVLSGLESVRQKLFAGPAPIRNPLKSGSTVNATLPENSDLCQGQEDRPARSSDGPTSVQQSVAPR
ncbi:relaxase/mobilization nuclease domain-containing protein [Donghicola mangrovi]|uniref:Relaxase/mobilization nuclease domain-containing protein n=1 Tax=Donghicola mangrovi TaxID=2729614 RepID=A0A850Q7B7_9RHOB|nr:relaxase/mobilization nuclease domain-containing protein [Donghicola mangrovi]NVO22630.1 relaxase/mobilization nuclease domain-containing protein [Donghicola mangrovi]